MVPYSVMVPMHAGGAAGGTGVMGGWGCDHQHRTGGVDMWMLRWSRLLFALVVCVAALGCSSAVDRGGGGGRTQQSDGGAAGNAAQQSGGTPGSPGESPLQPSSGGGGAPGAPGNGGNQSGAVVAPIMIPAFDQDGQPISTAKPAFEQAIKENCKDGTVCLNVEVRPSDADPTKCGFDNLEYPEGTPLELGDATKQANRGDTVVMVCTPGSAADSTEPSQDTTGSTETSQPQPTDTTASPESSQPQSSDTTGPADSGQSPPSSS